MTGGAHSEGVSALLESGFRDAVMVVMGGRGGIGGEVVRQAASLGARVVIGSSSAGEETLTAPAAGETATLRVDIRDSNSVAHFFGEIERAIGRIDILVNSAGASRQIPLRRLDLLTDELIDDVFASNAVGVLKTIREAAPLLKAGRDPVIVNVTSVAARTGGGSNLAYVGAKASVEAMSIGLAKALAPEIRVVSVAPSALDTGFVRDRGADFFDATIKATPLARLTSLPEVANAILCAARILTATTGVSIAVDGGRHL